MTNAGFLMLGTLFGLSLAYFIYSPVHRMHEELDVKIERILGILAQWQKKT